MTKPVIVNATAGAVVAAKQWLMADGSGAVIANTAPGTGIGFAESFADPALPAFKSNKVGVVKQGLAKLQAIAGTYKFGDSLGLDATGQLLDAAGTTKVATCAEPATLVLAAPGEVLVYVSVV